VWDARGLPSPVRPAWVCFASRVDAGAHITSQVIYAPWELLGWGFCNPTKPSHRDKVSSPERALTAFFFFTFQVGRKPLPLLDHCLALVGNTAGRRPLQSWHPELGYQGEEPPSSPLAWVWVGTPTCGGSVGVAPTKNCHDPQWGPRVPGSTRPALSVRTLARGGCRCPRALIPPTLSR
jgi:hypothetical protein